VRADKTAESGPRLLLGWPTWRARGNNGAVFGAVGATKCIDESKAEPEKLFKFYSAISLQAKQRNFEMYPDANKNISGTTQKRAIVEKMIKSQKCVKFAKYAKQKEFKIQVRQFPEKEENHSKTAYNEPLARPFGVISEILGSRSLKIIKGVYIHSAMYVKPPKKYRCLEG